MQWLQRCKTAGWPVIKTYEITSEWESLSSSPGNVGQGDQNKTSLNLHKQSQHCTSYSQDLWPKETLNGNLQSDNIIILLAKVEKCTYDS